MKFQTEAGIKIFILLIAVLFVAAALKANSKNYPVNPAENLSVSYVNSDSSIYARYCARCHGNDGRAQTPKGKQTGATNFTSPKWQPNGAKAIRTITNGKGKMPAFKDSLNEEQIQSVWNYVRGFKK